MLSRWLNKRQAARLCRLAGVDIIEVWQLVGLMSRGTPAPVQWVDEERQAQQWLVEKAITEVLAHATEVRIAERLSI